MLKIIQACREVDDHTLLAIYAESLQKELTEAGLLEDIRVSIRKHNGALFLWEHDGIFVSTLRCEPYTDGYLIYGLETMPDYRRQGFATKLVEATISYLAQRGKSIYSHIHKRNKSSLALHKKLGFVEQLDYAKLIDGTVSQNYITAVYNTKNTDMAD